MSEEAEIQIPEDIEEPRICCVCGQTKLNCCPDEGDVWWCQECMGKWEQDNQAHWENGQPFKKD